MTDDRQFPATALPDHDWWQALWPDPEGVLLKLGISPGLIVLDLCCGDGYFTLPLARLTAVSLYGLDLNPELIAEGKKAAAEAGVTNIYWMTGDAYNADGLIPEPVDYVLIANTFHGVPDKPRLLEEVKRALKPGGRLAIVNWHQRPRAATTVLGEPRGPATQLRMPPEDVTELAEAAGFGHTSTINLPPYHYGSIFHRD